MATTDAVHAASALILEERLREQRAAAARHQTYAVYVNSTLTPEDAHPAVKIVEATLKANCVAAAKFHANEAARFEAALEAMVSA